MPPRERERTSVAAAVAFLRALPAEAAEAAGERCGERCGGVPVELRRWDERVGVPRRSSPKPPRRRWCIGRAEVEPQREELLP